MSHWADTYVGRPAEGPRPCWLLVRQVWIDRLGLVMPRFDEADDAESVFAHEAMAFADVPRGSEQELDAVMMLAPGRAPVGSGQRALRVAESHIGVIVAKGLVLHVERQKTAVIEPLKSLKVSRVLRGPWGTLS